MTTKQKWALGLSLAALVAIIYFWDDIVAQWKKWFPGEEETPTPKDGDACKDTNGNTSVIENGACKEVSKPGPNGGGGGGGGGNGGNGGNAAV